MLGQDLCPLLASKYETVAWTRAEADVTDGPALHARIADLSPQVVINCAAATHVDRCETEPDWAYRNNAWGAWNATSAAAAAGARLIHVSTDFVFSGETDRPYTEWDATGPLSVYGASKLAGETAALRAAQRVSIVRTQWLYGCGGASFPRAILNAARKKPDNPLRVVADQLGAPTYTRHLAAKLAWLVEWPTDGIYHVNNAGECSRYEWAQELLRLAGLADVPVAPIRADEWPAPAPRPRRSTLRRYALELMGQDDLPTWQDGLREFVQELR
ncbi:MAG: dTDP-4-dehydrorhamnose reductase, partial [Armatimonadetes bacterium]|nr:dTDP-4-dehydrorhamnose reductase [Armatimonadota bacterium]